MQPDPGRNWEGLGEPPLGGWMQSAVEEQHEAQRTSAATGTTDGAKNTNFPDLLLDGPLIKMINTYNADGRIYLNLSR